MGRWQQWVDPRVAAGGRWHSRCVALTRSPTILGDHLVSQLRELARATGDDMALARAGQFLNKKLRGFEGECRLLIRLADSARVILLLQRTIESVLGMEGLLRSKIREIWDNNLESERIEWIREIETVLRDEKKMTMEMGDADQQMKILTLLKHQLDHYSHVLTSRETDVVSEVFDMVARRGNVTVGNLPLWFATSELEWFRAKRTFVEEGEEACERQAAVWAKLHHPNVRKFFGACHVGNPFVIHEACSELPLSKQNIPRRRRSGKMRGGERTFSKKWSKRGARAVGNVKQTWGHVLGCALGLQYVHDRGLVHERLTEGNLLYSHASQKGILSGMGLVRRPEIDNLGSKASPSVSSDILAFGLAVFVILVKDRSPDRIPSLNVGLNGLPVVRLGFIKKTEWDLLLGICAPDPAERTCMADIVHQLRVLARRVTPPVAKSLTSYPATIENIREYEIQTLGMTLEATLEEIKQLCDGTDNNRSWGVNRPVYNRLVDVYQQFLASSKPVSMIFVESFSLIVLRFFDTLDERVLGSTGVVASICASGTVADKNYRFHHDLDVLLRTSDLQNTTRIHEWQTTWKESRRRQGNAMKSCLEKPQPLRSQLSNDMDRATNAPLGAFSSCLRNPYRSESSSGLVEIGEFDELPLWFIPPYEVQLGSHIADGSFGAVYEGEWLDTDVVVKQVLLDPTDNVNWEQFRREADLWFSLNHPNLIKLYGACHQGRPFFVCEPASHGTFASYLKGKNRRTVWLAIGDVALGLQHLHDHDIIHGDLKGNNILVCDNADGLPAAKLADFGLSIVTKQMGASVDDENGALGAYRWKAPECLLGARPTFASDIYSLGMCIIEAVTGQYPWGNTVPDPVVIRNVVEMQSLPPRPECMNDGEWRLVTRMCRFGPQCRIPIGAVINCAFNLAASRS